LWKFHLVLDCVVDCFVFIYIAEICSVANGASKKEVGRAKEFIVKQLEEEMGKSMEMGTIHAGDFLVCESLSLCFKPYLFSLKGNMVYVNCKTSRCGLLVVSQLVKCNFYIWFLMNMFPQAWGYEMGCMKF
jgi:hypothetical protein